MSRIAVLFRKLSFRYMVAVSTLTGGAFLLVGGILLYRPIQAIAWHCVHNSELFLDKETKIHLPMLWWVRDSKENGELVLCRARFGSDELMSEAVILPLDQDVKALNEKDAHRLQEKMDETQTSADPLEHRLVSIQSKDVRGYCMKDESPVGIYSFCRMLGVPKAITFFGTASDLKEMEAILSTAKR